MFWYWRRNIFEYIRAILENTKMTKWIRINERWNQENTFCKSKTKGNLMLHYQEINVLVHNYFLKNRRWNIDYLGLIHLCEWNFKLVKMSKRRLKMCLTDLTLINIDLFLKSENLLKRSERNHHVLCFKYRKTIEEVPFFLVQDTFDVSHWISISFFPLPAFKYIPIRFPVQFSSDTIPLKPFVWQCVFYCEIIFVWLSNKGDDD